MIVCFVFVFFSDIKEIVIYEYFFDRFNKRCHIIKTFESIRSIAKPRSSSDGGLQANASPKPFLEVHDHSDTDRNHRVKTISANKVIERRRAHNGCQNRKNRMAFRIITVACKQRLSKVE